jgi:hypothetical protein
VILSGGGADETSLIEKNKIDILKTNFETGLSFLRSQEYIDSLLTLNIHFTSHLDNRRNLITSDQLFFYE